MDKSPFLPAESDIEHVVKRIVEEAHEVGRAPGDVKLEECVERLQFGYEAIITDDIATLKTICRHLRSYQRKSLGKEELGRLFPGDISSEDLQCLEDRNWLNDKIINRYMDMIAEEYPTIAVAVSSFFIETLNKKPENLPDFRNKVALIPCCLNSHWSVVAALERQKSLVIFSSMSNQIEDDDLATFLRLRTHFCATYDGRWDLRIHTSLKSQTNSDDCGVFVLSYARSFVEGGERLTLVGQSHMKKIRKHITQELMEGNLVDWKEVFQRKPRARPKSQRNSILTTLVSDSDS